MVRLIAMALDFAASRPAFHAWSAKRRGSGSLPRYRGGQTARNVVAIAAAIALLLPVAALSQPTPANEIVLRVAVVNPPDHPSVITLHQLATILATKSNGRIKLQIFPASQLGSTNELLNELRSGAIQMNILNPPILAQLEPRVGVFAAPYIFPDLNSAYKAAASPTGKAIMSDLLKVNIRTLDPWYLGGWNLLTNKRLVRKCDDLAGLKVRVPPGPVLKDFMAECGADVTEMTFGEVYLALKTGVIDAIPMPLAIIQSGKLYEVTHYATMHTFLYDLFFPLINEQAWEHLSPADQQLLVDTFAQGRTINDALALKQEANAAQLLTDHHLQLETHPDVPSFQRAAAKTWAKFEDQWGGKATVDKLIAAAK